tara:strand:- start:13501 stop:13983 length:483 start_codon:yes stop_codon:yes gene_type:complete
MADRKITALTELSSGVANTDVLHIIDDAAGSSPTNKKITTKTLFNEIPSYLAFPTSGEGYDDQTVSSSAAVSTNTFVTFLTTTDTTASTLANGNAIGQIKVIVHKTDGGSTVCTPATKSGFTNLTFTDAGDTAVCMWTGAAWVVLSAASGSSGDADTIVG